MSIGILLALCALTDETPGVNTYCAHASRIAIVRAPADEEPQFLLVEEVLKGILFEHRLPNPEGTLRPGQKGILLYLYMPPSHYFPYLQSDLPPREEEILIWPMDEAGVISAGTLPLHSHGGGDLPTGEVLRIGVIQDFISSSSPEEVGLNSQVVMACVRPDGLAELTKRDPDRATYVRFYTALRDLDRDVPQIALLLESPDPATAEGAARRLRELTGADAKDWPAWWKEQHRGLVWDVALQKWMRGSAPGRAWPPVPTDFRIPAEKPNADLVEAIRQRDATAFAKGFRAWLDSGIVRERLIAATWSLPQNLVNESHLLNWGGGSGPYLPRAPRLPAETVLGRKHVAEHRLGLMFLAAADWHLERFRVERLEARVLVGGSDPDSEIVRRAAFWEFRESNMFTVGTIAVLQLARSKSPESRKQLQQQILAHIDDATYGAAGLALKQGSPSLAAAMVAYVEKHDDDTSGWCVRLLVYNCPDLSIVHKLIEWHNGTDPALQAKAKSHLKILHEHDVQREARDLFRFAGIPLK